VLEGDFHWHRHDDQDEFFMVVEGQLLIDLRPAIAPSRSSPIRVSSFRVARCTHPRSSPHDRAYGRGRRVAPTG
jgi:mannose-6-phosphate isomerase-like protein (cupin superfamily)